MSNCQVHRAADRVTPQPNNKAFSTKAPMVSVGIDLRDSAGNGILLKGVTASGTLFLNALKSIVHMNGGFVKMNEDGNFIDKVVFPQLGLEIKGIQYYMNGGLPFKVEDGKSDWENITETRVTSNIMATATNLGWCRNAPHIPTPFVLATYSRPSNSSSRSLPIGGMCSTQA